MALKLGVFRTWVKYIEQGAFPGTRRFFSVLRCNHCDDAPYLEVCPVPALYRREDGIVDFDPQRCIGCKACLNAYPYDALYIDPNSHTAAKCNFCAHRVDAGLKPSCEIVCPTQAIISGDLDDPDSEVRRLLDTEAATGELRRPIWLFRPVKPVLDAYKLPDDERTTEARAAASGSAPSAFDLAERVDWSPAETWGALYSDGLSRRSESSSSS